MLERNKLSSSLSYSGWVSVRAAPSYITWMAKTYGKYSSVLEKKIQLIGWSHTESFRKKMTFKQYKDDRVPSSSWVQTFSTPPLGNNNKITVKEYKKEYMRWRNSKQESVVRRGSRITYSLEDVPEEAKGEMTTNVPGRTLEDPVHQDFLNLNTIDIWRQIILCCGWLSNAL